MEIRTPATRSRMMMANFEVNITFHSLTTSMNTYARIEYPMNRSGLQ